VGMAEVGALITDDLAFERSLPHPILVRPERDETEADQAVVPDAVRVQTTRSTANSLSTLNDALAEAEIDIEAAQDFTPSVSDDAIIIEPTVTEAPNNVALAAASVAAAANTFANQPVTDVRALQAIVNENIPEIAVPVVPAPQVPLTEPTLVPVIVVPTTAATLSPAQANAIPVAKDPLDGELGRLDTDILTLEGLENEQEEAERNGEQVAPPEQVEIEAEDAEIALLTQAVPLPSDRLIADIPLAERYALAAGASRETLRTPSTVQTAAIPVVAPIEANEEIDSTTVPTLTLAEQSENTLRDDLASLEAELAVNAAVRREQATEPVEIISAENLAVHPATTAQASQIAGSVLATNVRPESVEALLSPDSDTVKALAGVTAISTTNPDIQHHLQNQNGQVGSRHGEAAKLRHQRQLATLEHIDLYV
jgi:hypothetical protein